jgi:hypothetical protein
MKNRKDAIDLADRVLHLEQELKDAAWRDSPNVSSFTSDTSLNDCPSSYTNSRIMLVLPALKAYASLRGREYDERCDFISEGMLGMSMDGVVGATPPQLLAIGKRHIERLRKERQRHDKDNPYGLAHEEGPKDTRGYNSDGLREGDEDA